ncbi:hypothetical protein ACLOJK_015362 [Asimina triloba]
MGGVVGKAQDEPSPKSYAPETKLEAKMVEAMQRRALEGTSMKLSQSYRFCNEVKMEMGTIFSQYWNHQVCVFCDEDSNGAIDPEELKHCFHKLEVKFSDEEINDLFLACDIYENMGMKFNEFIVLLCLVYLLKEDPQARQAKSRMGLPDLEATFESVVDAFVFLDKNKDGYVSKNEMVQAINETTTGERSSGRIAMKRFVVAVWLILGYFVIAEEMDWDKNGMVTFKEFLFAFTRWIGMDDIDDDED